MDARAQRLGWRHLAVGVALVTMVAACGSGGSATASPSAPASPPQPTAGSSTAASPSAAAASPSAAAFTPQRASGIPGALLPSELKLWKYDSSAGKYVEVPGDASAPYVPNDNRTAPKPYTIGYIEGWAANPASALIHKGIYDWAAKMGVKIITCDAQFDPDKALTCAETIAQQKPDFIINANWRSEAATAMSKIFDAAKIPSDNADVMHPDAVFFGADNYVSGHTAGTAAGDYAQKAGVCADVTVLLGGNPGEGEAANQRLTGFSDGIQEKCGPLPADRIANLLFDAGTPDQALTKTTDWLTANPNVKYVLATSIDDERVTGMTKALTQSSRQGIGVGQGCDDVGIAATKEGTPDKTHWLGCVGFFFEKYGDYVMSIALDVLAGTPVPQEVHMDHKMLTYDNIKQYYP
jgi:ribose transport system substrate-binding protein